MYSSKDIFYYVYLWLGYNLLDVITTHLGLAFGFPEGNPLPAAILKYSSPIMLPVYKLTVALLWLGLVVILARRWRRMWVSLRLANVLVFGAVFWNALLIGPSMMNDLTTMASVRTVLLALLG